MDAGFDLNKVASSHVNSGFDAINSDRAVGTGFCLQTGFHRAMGIDEGCSTNIAVAADRRRLCDAGARACIGLNTRDSDRYACVSLCIGIHRHRGCHGGVAALHRDGCTVMGTDSDRDGCRGAGRADVGTGLCLGTHIHILGDGNAMSQVDRLGNARF